VRLSVPLSALSVPSERLCVPLVRASVPFRANIRTLFAMIHPSAIIHLHRAIIRSLYCDCSCP
jgi:hypothetical protein